MKNQSLISKTETFEDIVFEGRNKSYGAYDLNCKQRKYLIIAFLFSLIGVSTAVAVPFIRALNGDGSLTPYATERKVDFRPVPIHEDIPPPPPPPPQPDVLIDHISYSPPIVVLDAPPESGIMINSDLAQMIHNPPVPPEIELVPVDQGKEIEEPKETWTANPQEHARFMGGDIHEFHQWVVDHITYPQEAINVNIFGRVIVEFCVNSKGEVVDIIVLRELDPLIDRETVRVIASSPLWTPAKQGGRPVKQHFVIPFTFKMQ